MVKVSGARFTLRSALLAAAIGSLLLAAHPGCSRPQKSGMRETALEAPSWPPPPKQARIVFKGVVREPVDWGFKKTIPGRLWDIVAGKARGTEFGAPYAVAVGPSEMVAVTDTARGGVYIFDPARRRYKIVHRAKKRRLLSPVGAAFDSSGFLYVADSANRQIFVFNPKGKFEKVIGGPEVFQRPTGLAIDDDRRTLYVTDTVDCSIIAMDLDGAEKWRFGRKGTEKGTMNYPTHIALAPDGTLVVNDAMNFRVQLIDPEGKFIYMFGNHGDGTGDFARPRGIAVDSQWHIYVSDALFDVVQIFDRQGNYLLNFGGTGGNIGQMYMPAGIAIDDKGRMTVADQGNRRLQIFQYIHESEEGEQ